MRDTIDINSNDNVLFITSQCNNRCLMCCQPPNNNDDLEILGNIVDELRKVREGGTLKKWSPTVALRLKKSGKVDIETVQAVTKINQLIYALGNMDFSHKRVYNGETWNDVHNRWEHEQD